MRSRPLDGNAQDPRIELVVPVRFREHAIQFFGMIGGLNARHAAFLVQEMDDLAAHEYAQPVAKPTLLGLVFKGPDAPRHLCQNLLANVRGVGVLKIHTPAIAIYHHQIGVNERLPGFGISRITNAHQEAGPRRLR